MPRRALLPWLLRGPSEGPTRLHTGRGQLLPPYAWGDVGRATRDRLRGQRPQVPWMAPGAVRALHRLLHPEMTLLELGSGASTAWYAERVGRVV